jgi:hypothetical protein
MKTKTNGGKKSRSTYDVCRRIASDPTRPNRARRLWCARKLQIDSGKLLLQHMTMIKALKGTQFFLCVVEKTAEKEEIKMLWGQLFCRKKYPAQQPTEKYISRVLRSLFAHTKKKRVAVEKKE